MDNLLDVKRNVELTGADCVVVRQALRNFVEIMSKYVADALNENNYAAAVIHNERIADAIKVFGKVL